MANEPTTKREAIIEAASHLFIHKAFHEVKLDEVAQIAGVAKGSIYTYFKSKDDLFLKIIFSAIDTGKRQISEIVNEKDTFKKKLSKLIKSHVVFAGGAGQMMRVAMENLPKLIFTEENFQCFKQKREEFVSILARFFEQGFKEKCVGTSLNPRQLAAFFGEIFKLNHEFEIFGETKLTEKQVFEVLSGILQLS